MVGGVQIFHTLMMLFFVFCFLFCRGVAGVYLLYHLLRESKASNYKGESKCSSLCFHKLCFTDLKAVLLGAGHKRDLIAGQSVFKMLAYRSGPSLEFAVWDTDFTITLMDWNGLLVLNLYEMIHADHLPSFWNSGILLRARQSVST